MPKVWTWGIMIVHRGGAGLIDLVKDVFVVCATFATYVTVRFFTFFLFLYIFMRCADGWDASKVEFRPFRTAQGIDCHGL